MGEHRSEPLPRSISLAIVAFILSLIGSGFTFNYFHTEDVDLYHKEQEVRLYDKLERVQIEIGDVKNILEGLKVTTKYNGDDLKIIKRQLQVMINTILEKRRANLVYPDGSPCYGIDLLYSSDDCSGQAENRGSEQVASRKGS